MRLLRAYDKGEVTLEETLEAALVYGRLYGDNRDYESAYSRTLSDKPWQTCRCPICNAIGVEVIVFRGNNRNRRRGFHNVKVFYDQLQRLIREPALDLQSEKDREKQVAIQLKLDLG